MRSAGELSFTKLRPAARSAACSETQTAPNAQAVERCFALKLRCVVRAPWCKAQGSYCSQGLMAAGSHRGRRHRPSRGLHSLDLFRLHISLAPHVQAAGVKLLMAIRLSTSVSHMAIPVRPMVLYNTMVVFKHVQPRSQGHVRIVTLHTSRTVVLPPEAVLACATFTRQPAVAARVPP